MRVEDIQDRIYDGPFKPFRMHLTDGSSVDVTEPGMLMVGPASVLLPTRFGKDEEGRPLVLKWRTVAIPHIVQFSDVDEPVEKSHQPVPGT